MDSAVFQLSHEELLLVLGLLELPTPLALGPRPADGYEAVGLGAALAGAGASLVARDLACPGAEPPLPPTPAPALAMIARAAALAEGCLILAERRGDERRAAHLTVRGDELVLHTSPAPRVHRLERMRDAAAATAWLAASITTDEGTGAPTVRAPAAALASALEALEAGRPAAAQAQLDAAGVDGAAAFLLAVGPTPTRFALGALRGLGGQDAAARGAVALCGGGGGAWWGEIGPDWVELRPIAAAALRTKIADMVAWMQG